MFGEICQIKILDNLPASCYNTAGIKQESLTGGESMESAELILLYDYYGDLLTQRQKECFELRYNQDLSLGEIGQELGISRQAAHDNLTRTEALLKNMEAKTGCVRRDMHCRAVLEKVRALADQLANTSDESVMQIACQIQAAVTSLEE